MLSKVVEEKNIKVIPVLLIFLRLTMLERR